MRNSLWSRSSLWRWTLISTVLSTIAALLGSHWISFPPGAHKALYIPSASPMGGLPNTSQNQQFADLYSPTASAVHLSDRPKPTRDETFDVALPRPAEIFPSGTELHMIGVYEGDLPDGVKETSWRDRCTDSNGTDAPSLECRQKYAGRREPRKVTVEIDYGAPLVLALMSYEPVIWEIEGEGPSQLKKVILAGYHGQDISGVGDDVPVDVYTYEPSTCRNCRKEPGYFYTYTGSGQYYADAVAKLKAFTGLKPYSFQGSYKANFFALTPAVARLEDDHDQPISYDEPSSGRIYSDRITLANTQIPLPAGMWQVIAYTRIPHGAKEDALISLAQNDDGVLKSLYAVRIEVAATHRRFTGNLSCQNEGNYFEKTVSDSPDGTQLCYWIEHLSSPWQQPLFDITASRLQSMGVKIPSNVVNIGFYKANATTSITAYLYANPEAKSIYTQPSNWYESPWNKNHIHQDPKRESFMTEQQRWAETWLQYFRVD